MLFDSNVFNMIDWSNNGVEPCTGMYIQNIKLARLVGNKLQGPELDLLIRFNQFQKNDYGFGTGWEFNLSRIDNENGIKTLVLSDGSRYVMTETSDSVTLQYKRTQCFTIQKNSTDTYTLVNKSNITETLTNGKCTQITAANGEKISLAWDTSDGYALKISDESNSQLFAVKKTTASSEYTMTIQVQDGKFVYYIDKKENTVPALSGVLYVPSGKEKPVPLYSLAYLAHNTSYLMITSFRSCIQYRQEDKVQYAALPAPSGLTATVYAVSQLEQFLENEGSTPFYRTLTYSNPRSNYLGTDHLDLWKSGQDNLQFLPDAFYFTRTVREGNERVTWNNYNKFYLPIREEPMLPGDTPETGGKDLRKFKTYDYNLVKEKGIDSQPSTFMLPIRQSDAVLQRFGMEAKPKTVVIEFEYDAFANLTRFLGKTGIQESYTYYPAQGETDPETGRVLCPPDPASCINYIKLKTITPFPVKEFPANSKCYAYEYMAMNNMVLLATEQFHEQTTSASPSILQQNTYSYDDSSDFPGQLAQAIEGMPPFTQDSSGYYQPNQSTRFSYTRQLSPDNSMLTTTKKTTGFDGTFITDSTVQSVATGAIVSSTDENNSVTTFSYDGLGLLTSTSCTDRDGNTSMITFFRDRLNNRIITKKKSNEFSDAQVFDGLGNLVNEQIITQDNITKSPIEFKMSALKYNTLNQLVSKTIYDYAPNNNLISIETTALTWNIFDEIIVEKNPDKSSNRYEYNHIENTVTQFSTPGHSKIVCTYNAFEQLVMKATFPQRKGYAADSFEMFSHDGYWRLRHHSRTGYESQEYEYDAFDRQIKKTGSSSGIKTTRYASHTSAELPVEYTLGSTSDSDAAVIGQQFYDSLNRKTNSVINNLNTIYDYSSTPLFDHPGTVTGKYKYIYTYNILLNQVTDKKVYALNNMSRILAQQKFNYDKGTGLLSQSSTATANPYESFVSQFSYDRFNNLTSEFCLYDRDPQELPWESEATAVLTIRGKPLRSTTQFILGFRAPLKVNTTYQYESNGAIQQIDYRINGELITRSLFHRALNGNLVHIESYILWPGPRYARIDKKTVFSSYNQIQSITYLSTDIRDNKDIFGYNKILHQRYAYDPQQRLIRIDLRFETNPPQIATERYAYDKTGSIIRWNKYGDILFLDERGNRIFDQAFTYNIYKNISTVKNEYTQQGKNISSNNTATYQYSDIFTLNIITNKTTNASALPVQIKFKTSKGGDVMLRQELTAKGATTKSTSYLYSGSENCSRITEYFPGKKIKFDHYFNYDAYGRIISSRIKYADDPEDKNWIIKDKVFSGDVLAIESRYSMHDKTKIEYTIYHYVNGEVMFISQIDAKGDLQTCPCLNQADGTLLAQGYPDARRLYWYKYEPVYKFQTSGKNAYGLTMGLRSAQYSISRMYSPAELPGKD